jgi:hypothetical protein
MYNLIAWLTGSKFRKCDYCDRVRQKSTMLHTWPGNWDCDIECRNLGIEEAGPW